MDFFNRKAPAPIVEALQGCCEWQARDRSRGDSERWTHR